MIINNKSYDILKYICLIGLPALSFLIGQLGEIWGIKNVREVVLTINAVATTLGILLQISSYKYNKEMNKND